MCGIAGIYTAGSSRRIDAAVLARMGDVLQHRGPDGGDIYVGEEIGLAHRRLAIIDLANGDQPFRSEDGKIVLVYNGEIYNFRELRVELEARGHLFRTDCDTEVLLASWREWGEDCVTQLRGMFAFALWDARTRTLFFARDRIGIKPLYYGFLPDGTVVFGSELKALLVHPELDRALDPEALEDYLALGYVPEPKSIFKSVRKLPAGYALTFNPGNRRPEPRQYWDLSFTAAAGVPEPEVAEALIAKLSDAVASHLVADVPLGAFLSGGVDSSAVVALMAQVQTEPVNTCAIGFRERAFDETRYAREVAELYHTNHRERQVTASDHSLIDTLAELYDEPFADSSAMPTYRVCQVAREQVTVALSGDGGDENFAGYRRYRMSLAEDRVRRLVPDALLTPLFGALGRFYPKADWAPRMFRAKSTFQSLARDAVSGYCHSVSVTPDSLRLSLYDARFRVALQGYRADALFHSVASRAPTSDPLAMLQYLDFKTWLPGDILTKVDRASMAHSLEVRVPVLDHEFVEWAASVPSSLKIRRGETKYIMKKALMDHLPRDLLYRKKMGFSIPLARWFRGPLRERVRDAVTQGRLIDSGYFDVNRLQQLVDRHVSGQSDYSATLWSLTMLDAFLRRLESPHHQGTTAYPAEPTRATG